MPPDGVHTRLTVNGRAVELTVEPRTTLADALRDELALTGTHVGCEQGACGACTVLVDGASLRSCLFLAVQAEGCAVRTVEGLAPAPGPLHPIQQAFTDHHALQCGFCTPGLLMTAAELLSERSGLDEAEIRRAVAGHLCRCTGYQGIVEALAAADRTWDRPLPTPLPEET